MESTLVWLLIFAGAAIILLGLFLFASEKELKVKRHEIEALSAKLNDLPEAKLDGSVADQETGGYAELSARNDELSEQVAALTVQLQQSQDIIGELQAADPPSSMETEMAQLRSSYQRLLEENSQLKNQLWDNEERLHDSSTPSSEIAEPYSQMEAQLADLRDELEKSLTKIRELESQQEIAELESSHSALLERESLQTRISELENELASETEKLAEFNLTQSRLSEVEGRYVSMAEENKRLQKEIIRCHEQLADSEQNRRRLELVGQHIDQVELKHAALAQQHGEMQEEITALRNLLSAAPEKPLQLELSDDPVRSAGHPFAPHAAHYATPGANEETGDAFSRHTHRVNERPQDSAREPTGQPSLQKQNEATHASHASLPNNGKQSYKILVGMIPVLLIAGTVAAGFLRKYSTEPEAPIITTAMPEHDPERLAEPKAGAQKLTPVTDRSANKEAPPASLEKRREAQVLASDRYSREAQVKTVAATSAEPNPRFEEPASAKNAVSSRPAQEAAKPPLRVWGGYEIVRSTQVYSEPTESSQPLGKLDSGTQVNVVSARAGWLEIRSKNGRPPGFIKSDAAVRMGQN